MEGRCLGRGQKAGGMTASAVAAGLIKTVNFTPTPHKLFIFLNHQIGPLGNIESWTKLLSSISDRQTGRKERNCCNGMRPRFQNLNTVTLPLSSS